MRRSDAECVVRIDNNGAGRDAVGVAVALFDEAGNLVAAGSGGTRAGWLAAGEHDTSAIGFPFVYRNMEKAKTFLVTLEVQPRPAKDATASATADVRAGAGRARPARRSPSSRRTRGRRRRPVARALDAAGALPVRHAGRLLGDELLVGEERA